MKILEQLFIRPEHLMNKKAGKSFWLLFVTLHTCGHGSRTVRLWKRWDMTTWQGAPFWESIDGCLIHLITDGWDPRRVTSTNQVILGSSPVAAHEPKGGCCTGYRLGPIELRALAPWHNAWSHTVGPFTLIQTHLQAQLEPKYQDRPVSL